MSWRCCWLLAALLCTGCSPGPQSLGISTAGGLQVALSSEAPPHDRFVLSVTDASSHQPVDGVNLVSVASMSAMFMPPQPSSAQPLGQGRYLDQPQFVHPGQWDYAVTVSRNGVPVATVHFPLQVGE